MQKFDFAIIGGGILGTTISYWLSSMYDVKVCVVEKENNVAKHASGRNTGVVHSPFYLNPETKKILAKSAITSYPMWEAIAKERKIPWLKTGVFEIALNKDQHKSLEEYMKWGIANGIPEGDLELFDGNDVSKREPNLKCDSAIFCKREVSSDFAALTREIRTESEKNGTKFLFNNNVKSIETNKEFQSMTLAYNSKIDSDFIINCAGGNALDIAKKMDLAKEYSDLHFRGEYWVADPQYRDLVKTTIYTVAEFKGYPFLDPHWIKKANGGTEIGPNAVPVPSPDTYSGYLGDASTTLSKLKEIVTGNAVKLLSDPEFLSLISKEWLSSISKVAMVKRIQKFIPKIQPAYFTKRGTAGIRSPLISPQGKFVTDVIELQNENSYHIINYNSPGATGAPAYAAFVVKKLHDKGILNFPIKSNKGVWDFQKITNQMC
jgi:L-2-hydroxyglutarate oxidase